MLTGVLRIANGRVYDPANGAWSTTINTHHDVEWTPPPHLDTGQTRINHYHHPERLFGDDDAC